MSKILQTVDFANFSDFSGFVHPLYNRRRDILEQLENDPGNDELQRQSLFLKLLLNNGYGKFAQDPRRFKERFIWDFGELPPGWTEFEGYLFDEKDREWEVSELVENGTDPELSYAIYSREPDVQRFNNVATAASITGAARSILLRAIANSNGALYCDTDSIICRDLPSAINSSDLGNWKLESEINEIIICGKKLYGYTTSEGKTVTRSKGVKNLTMSDLETILRGVSVEKANIAPTMKRDGRQVHIRRSIKLTAEQGYKSRALTWKEGS